MKTFSELLKKSTKTNAAGQKVIELNKVFEILESCKIEGIALLGGDVYTESEKGIVMAHTIWGNKYHSLNWYANQEPNETDREFSHRSIRIAEKAITEIEHISSKLKMNTYLELVFKTTSI